MSPVPAAISQSNTFLQATLKTNKPIVNTIVEILVTCTEPLRYINYELLGRGDVLLAHTFQVEYTKVSTSMEIVWDIDYAFLAGIQVSFHRNPCDGARCSPPRQLRTG